MIGLGRKIPTQISVKGNRPLTPVDSAGGRSRRCPEIPLRPAASAGVQISIEGYIVEGRPTLSELRRWYIFRVLEGSDGNVTRVASTLRVDRRTLHRLLKRYGLTPRDSSED